MTNQGERAPQEPAASDASYGSLMDSFLSELDQFDGTTTPDAEANHVPNTRADDDQPHDASIDETERPVKGQEAVPASKDPLDAPSHWPEDRRRSFYSLPDDAKRVVLDRNKEANVAITKAQQEAAKYRRASETIHSMFTDDHRSQMASAGMDEAGAIRYLLQTHDAMNSDPVGFMKSLVQRTGITSEQLFGAPQQPATSQPQEPPVWRDPDVVAVENRLAEMQRIYAQDLSNREQQAKAYKQNEELRRQKWLQEQCDAFENTIGDDGNQKYAQLHAVMGDMANILRSDPAYGEILYSNPQAALEKAYNQALWYNAETRQHQLDDARSKWQAETESRNAVKKAQAAHTRRAAPGANGIAGPSKNTSYDEIAAQWIEKYNIG